MAADSLHQPFPVQFDMVFLDPGGLAAGHILLGGQGGQGGRPQGNFAPQGNRKPQNMDDDLGPAFPSEASNMDDVPF